MGHFARIRALIDDVKWGNWSLICLYLSLISGIVVGLQYDAAEPYYSTSAIDLLTPFGAYFRSLHFYSSQFFFLLAVVHFIAVFKKTEHYSARLWIFLVLTLPVIMMLLFTGYVLRGDSTGAAAGMIAEHIVAAVPLIGGTLNNLLFSITGHGMQRVYLHHVISFDILLLYLAWDHLRRYRVRVSDYLPFTAAVLLTSVFIAAPLDPEELGIFYITGPWFFLGLQELLRYLPPFTAGVIFPGVIIVGLILLRKHQSWYRAVLGIVLCWLAAYLVLTVLALTAHG